MRDDLASDLQPSSLIPQPSRLTRRDWVFIAVCVVVMAVSIGVIAIWFTSAFPESSIDFRFDGGTSQRLAQQLLAEEHLDTRGMKHTVVFDSDDAARIFLERSLGLRRANDVMKRDVHLWFWHHRWFRPLQEEELAVEIAPTGELVSMARVIPESRKMAALDAATSRRIAEQFLARAGAPNLEFLSASERKLPARVQRIYTWRSRSVSPAGAEYRHTITVDGDAVSSYGQRLKVPDEWLRGYLELRSKNGAAANIDRVFLAATALAVLVVFVIRLRRGDIPIRFVLGVGAVTFVLAAGSSLNSFPTALAGYDTTMSYPGFLARFVFFEVFGGSIGAAMALIVVCGAGEVLFRERFPQHLALRRVVSMRAITSKRVFRSILLGYTMVAFFIAYQTIFYVIAEKFGAWAPAEIPYDNTLLNTRMPWLAVLFAGFFPAVSEEFLSRAFSIPFFEKLFGRRSVIPSAAEREESRTGVAAVDRDSSPASRLGMTRRRAALGMTKARQLLAIVLAAYIWGFGHSLYPNQPFYIRGLEVGSAGVMLGFLLHAFGLLPLLIWHYTVDALYTALMLLRSHNIYYVVSGGVASMIFVIPFIASIALYVRNRGFVPDDDLDNARIPIAPVVEAPKEEAEAPLPASVPVTRKLVIACIVAVVVAIVLTIRKPASPQDVIDYRITAEQAKAIAAAHLRALGQPLPLRTAAVPVSAFRNWDADSSREEGGAPDGFDDIAATYMLRHGLPVSSLVSVMRSQIPTATWMVRFFTPRQKTEYLVEVDPRIARVDGFHKLQDERAPGPRLDQNVALGIAQRAFATYGVNIADFVLKDALTFEQPNRRDFLFHFEQRRALVAEAVRRIAVRVMGNEVTQFATTVKVPDAVYRDAHESTFWNIVLAAVRVIGAIIALALIVSGFIMATRHGLPHWQRAARFALALAIIPVLRALWPNEFRIFTYNTSTSWDTFLVNTTTNSVFTSGLQIGLIVAAVAAIFASRPYASRLFGRESRARFGRHAAIATLAALGILVAGHELLRLVWRLAPSAMSVGEISVPDEVVRPLPLILNLCTSIVAAVVFSGAAAAYAVTASSWKHRLAAPLVTMATIFCVTIDSSARLRELPMVLITSAALAAVVWVIARYVLNGNPLAWPMLAFTASLVESGASMLDNHRADLQVQGWIALAIVVGTLIWIAWEYRRPSEAFISAHAAGD